MDRQTDRILIDRPCLHSMQRGKKTTGMESFIFWISLLFVANMLVACVVCICKVKNLTHFQSVSTSVPDSNRRPNAVTLVPKSSLFKTSKRKYFFLRSIIARQTAVAVSRRLTV